jgi:DNA-binding NtrC family response regulator
MELVSLRKEVQKLRLEMERRFSINGLAAKSKIMKSILSTISRLSPEKTPTLFTGDSGTGKLFLSKVMHRSGNRSDRPFELVACSAIAASAQRTQIFGDAETDGMIQKAEGGILFLDDLDALSPECQQMLLQYLETGEFMQDQAEVPTQADVRIVAAILGNDEEIIKGQALHPDLYFKFSPFMIQLPSLQDRREDIPVLAQSFLEEFCKQNAVALKTLSPESMKILQNYSWPGNVRELQNVIERAVILSAGEKIGIDELPSAMTQLTNLGATKLPTNYSLEELEKAYIYQVLQDNNNHQGKTAQSLGIDRKTLWRKIRSYYPDAAQK